MIANFWRALQANPEEVSKYADWPVNESDQHARHLWLSAQEVFRERMKTDPEFYDAKIAGWWVWGQCIWIGSGWCGRHLSHFENTGTGVHRKLPHLGNAGRGINRQLPHLGSTETGVLLNYMQGLASRLRRVRVACGDWRRVCTPSVTFKHGITGVFLDPPYAEGNMDYSGGGVGTNLSAEVRRWALDNGDNTLLRIALCGYEGAHIMPNTWESFAWKAQGGYAKNGGVAEENACRERVWFSPHCLRYGLFEGLTI